MADVYIVSVAVVFFVLVFVVVLVFAVCAVVCVATDAALVVYTFLAGAVSESLFPVFSSFHHGRRKCTEYGRMCCGYWARL